MCHLGPLNDQYNEEDSMAGHPLPATMVDDTSNLVFCLSLFRSEAVCVTRKEENVSCDGHLFAVRVKTYAFWEIKVKYSWQ
jgi:hypothetical protein